MVPQIQSKDLIIIMFINTCQVLRRKVLMIHLEFGQQKYKKYFIPEWDFIHFNHGTLF